MKIDFHYFPKALQYTILILSLGVLYFLIQSESSKTMFFLIGINLLLFTRKFQIIIDLDKNLLIDKNLIFGFSFKTKKIEFKQLNHILIDKKRVHYTANSRGRTGVTDYYEYIGYLVFDENKMFEFRRSTDYKALKAEVQQLIELLKLDVVRNY